MNKKLQHFISIYRYGFYGCYERSFAVIYQILFCCIPKTTCSDKNKTTRGKYHSKQAEKYDYTNRSFFLILLVYIK